MFRITTSNFTKLNSTHILYTIKLSSTYTKFHKIQVDKCVQFYKIEFHIHKIPKAEFHTCSKFQKKNQCLHMIEVLQNQVPHMFEITHNGVPYIKLHKIKFHICN